MKVLCLAYGKEADWTALSEERRVELLAQDERLRERGAFVGVLGEPTVVRAWDGPIERSSVPYAVSDAPLVGFSIIDASALDEAVELRRRHSLRGGRRRHRGGDCCRSTAGLDAGRHAGAGTHERLLCVHWPVSVIASWW